MLAEILDTSGPLGALHLAGAMLALALGPAVFARPKGDRAHRWIGRAFVASLLAGNASALLVYEINGLPTVFHALALANTAMIVLGLWSIRTAARRGRARAEATHLAAMSWAWVGVVMAGAAQVAIRSRGEITGGWAEVIAILLACMAAVGLVAWRLIRRERRARLARG